ncbi:MULTISPECIES: NUDIX hydrolase [unclassified Paenibacillus]|uniref:NUDIX hydrolase n=1 Tax=unclassified Paenibacillus TaxID=185978 RepID=UPI000955D818|nr:MULTISPECIES: NUDIX hydrolase [unclassified Paenibacillus]ASS68593.1 NUDIX hydrolase [Paenibacillus sp. RUD330]SIR64224.1 ADP-ribose pyrophosphatase YjhB, NUDIX family [Paenibacillus sp. RU4X]SIR72309.1 ADP-ribose pyrophosphatase YjhB, NUDIX family [Paenibacillus sp. RU4T]
MEPKWLEWAKQIQAIAQTGLAYGRDVYDIERFEALRELSVEIMESHTSAGKEEIRLAFASGSGYATPKVDVRGAIFREGRILLVRERSDGAWCLPGGWADIGLTPSQCVIKEIREETGFEARTVRLLAVMDKIRHGHPPDAQHIYKLFFHCEITGGHASGGVETSEVEFFGEDELPPLSLSRNTESQLRMMFQYGRKPDMPVYYD